MKNRQSYGVIVSCLIMGCTILSLVGCEGKEGPAGSAGPAGVDGTAICGTCHNVSTTVKAKIIQWEHSKHATGGNFERNGTSCAICHTSEGFRERLVTGANATAAVIQNPTPPNCRTCHNIHTNYDETDFNLSSSSPVTLMINNETVDIGKGNLCALCHQPRPVSPMPTLNGPDVTITNRFGGHYGIQAATLGGTGYFEFPGETYTNSSHTTVVTEGCPTCHMADAYGWQAGGHTMKMSYDYHGTETQNLAGCKSCHSDIKNFDVNGVQTEVEGLLAELKTKLAKVGIYDEAAGLAKAGKWTALQAGAYLNFQMATKDRSEGVHNAKYIKAVLKNTIAALP